MSSLSFARTLGVGSVLPALGLFCIGTVQAFEGLVLPESTAERLPVLRCHVLIGQQRIAVDGVHLLVLDPVSDDDGVEQMAVPDDQKRGQLIMPLYDLLLEKREYEKARQDGWRSLAVLTQRPDLVPDGELLISVDVDTPFSVVREVLYTAGQAQYGSFRLVTHNPWQDALRTIEVDLPAIGPHPDAYEREYGLNLTIVVTAQGLDVIGVDGVLVHYGVVDASGPERPLALPCSSGELCVDIDDYDWVEFARVLGIIKDEYPDDPQYIVVPDGDVPYEVIVRVLDIARWSPHVPMDADTDEWEQWRVLRQPLFPWPIVAGGMK
jgi:hypothetical protein